MVEYSTFGSIVPSFKDDFSDINKCINKEIDAHINKLICEYLDKDFVHPDFIHNRFSAIYRGNNEILIIDNRNDGLHVLEIKSKIDFDNLKFTTEIKELFRNEKDYK